MKKKNQHNRFARPKWNSLDSFKTFLFAIYSSHPNVNEWKEEKKNEWEETQ